VAGVVTALVWIGVALASGVGAVMRFALHTTVQRRLAGVFPSGTLAVNLFGSLLLGLLHGAGVTGDALLLTGTALLGSFTTFSTWMLESERLAEGGEGRLALVNLAGSLALGLAAVALGWAVAATL
jgi:fluoride exporter